MSNKQLVFKRDVYDGEEVVYAKGKRYLITDEDDKIYYTGLYCERGIVKELDYIDYIVIIED